MRFNSRRLGAASVAALGAFALAAGTTGGATAQTDNRPLAQR